MNFSEFRGYICTSNPDGSIPLNSKTVCLMVSKESPELLAQLLDRANAYEPLVEALRECSSALADRGYGPTRAFEKSAALLRELGEIK